MVNPDKGLVEPKGEAGGVPIALARHGKGVAEADTKELLTEEGGLRRIEIARQEHRSGLVRNTLREDFGLRDTLPRVQF